MEEKLLSLSLRDGRNALKYVQSLRPEVRQIATEAILECSRLGYPLNDMEITSSKYRALASFIGRNWNGDLLTHQPRYRPGYRFQILR